MSPTTLTTASMTSGPSAGSTPSSRSAGASIPSTVAAPTQSSDVTTTDRRTSVYVTTQTLAVGRLPSRGKWFELKEYADHAAFMAAAHQYATEQHPNGEYTLQFMVFNEASFAIGNLTSQHHVSEHVWDMLDLHWCVVSVFHAYVTLFGISQGNVKHSLKLMADNYEGYYLDDSSYLEVNNKVIMKGVVRANGYYFIEH